MWWNLKVQPDQIIPWGWPYRSISELGHNDLFKDLLVRVLEIGHIDLFGFIRIWPLRWTQKVLQAKGIVFPCQPLWEKVRLEISIICVAWRLREYKMQGQRLETSKYGMPCAFGRSRMVTWPSWLIAPFPHSGLRFWTVNIKSVTVCRMNEIYINLILKWTGKRTGNEPETNFVIASIVSTGKSIEFYLFVKVGYYP